MDTPLGATEVEREISQLIAEYLADEPAADARYRYKTVAVSGVVLGIDPSSSSGGRPLPGLPEKRQPPSLRG